MLDEVQEITTKNAIRTLAKLGGALADEAEIPVVTQEIVNAAQKELAGQKE